MEAVHTVQHRASCCQSIEVRGCGRYRTAAAATVSSVGRVPACVGPPQIVADEQYDMGKGGGTAEWERPQQRCQQTQQCCHCLQPAAAPRGRPRGGPWPGSRTAVAQYCHCLQPAAAARAAGRGGRGPWPGRAAHLYMKFSIKLPRGSYPLLPMEQLALAAPARVSGTVSAGARVP